MSEQRTHPTVSCQKLGCQAWALVPEAQALESDLAAVRARAAALEVENAALRSELTIDGSGCNPEMGCDHPDDCPRGFVCMACGDGWDEGQPERHTASCILASEPGQHGALILEAGDQMAGAVAEHEPLLTPELQAALDQYRALRRMAREDGR